MDPKTRHEISYLDEYTTVLGVEWNMVLDCFLPLVSLFKVDASLTKLVLVSNIACLFIILGRFSPTIILMKVLLQ